MLQQLDLRRKVRLIGVGVSNFETRHCQLSLFEEAPQELEATSELDKAVDAVRKKFGPRAVTRVDLLDMKKKTS